MISTEFEIDNVTVKDVTYLMKVDTSALRAIEIKKPVASAKFAVKHTAAMRREEKVLADAIKAVETMNLQLEQRIKDIEREGREHTMRLEIYFEIQRSKRPQWHMDDFMGEFGFKCWVQEHGITRLGSQERRTRLRAQYDTEMAALRAEWRPEWMEWGA